MAPVPSVSFGSDRTAHYPHRRALQPLRGVSAVVHIVRDRFHALSGGAGLTAVVTRFVVASSPTFGQRHEQRCTDQVATCSVRACGDLRVCGVALAGHLLLGECVFGGDGNDAVLASSETVASVAALIGFLLVG